MHPLYVVERKEGKGGRGLEEWLATYFTWGLMLPLIICGRREVSLRFVLSISVTCEYVDPCLLSVNQGPNSIEQKSTEKLTEFPMNFHLRFPTLRKR